MRGRIPRCVIALLMTFVLCAGLHDLATVVVIVGRAVGLDFSHHPWATRAVVNLVYIFVCLGGALVLKPIFAAG